MMAKAATPAEPIVPDPPEEPQSPVEPVQPAPVEPASPEPTFLSHLAELEFSGIETPEQGQERLLEAYREQQARLAEIEQQRTADREFAEYGRQYMAELREQRAKPPATPQPSETWSFSPPHFDEALKAKYQEFDPESGMLRWKSGTPAKVIADSEARDDYILQWTQQIAYRPQEVFPKIVEQYAMPLFERMFEERMRQTHTETFVDQIKRENPWLWANDPRTNQPTQRFSQQGQRVMELVARVEQMGVTDPAYQWELANAMYRSEQTNGTPPVEQTAAQTAAAQRRTHQARGANAIPDRGGAVAPAAVRNKNLTPGQRLVEKAIADGLLTG
jgi:hypothetical protein